MSETSQQTQPTTETPAPVVATMETPPPAPTESLKTPEAPKDQSLLNQDEPKVPEGAPEKYDFKVPEGFELIPEVATSASALFKELGLSQASAQKLLDFHIKQTQDAQEAPYKAYADMRQEWKDKVAADPEFSGKLTQVKEQIGRLYDVVRNADPQNGAKIIDEFRQVMDMTGAGDNPAFIRVFSRVAKLLTENTRHVTGSGPTAAGQRAPGAAPPSAAKAIYPNLA